MMIRLATDVGYLKVEKVQEWASVEVRKESEVSLARVQPTDIMHRTAFA